MDKVLGLVERLFALSSNQQFFVVAVLAILLAGFSLCVLVVVLNIVLGKRGAK